MKPKEVWGVIEGIIDANPETNNWDHEYSDITGWLNISYSPENADFWLFIQKTWFDSDCFNTVGGRRITAFKRGDIGSDDIELFRVEVVCFGKLYKMLPYDILDKKEWNSFIEFVKLFKLYGYVVDATTWEALFRKN